jgi:TonB family protein
MNTDTKPSPRIRNTRREWTVIVIAAVLIHALFLMFFKPQYLEFLRKELPGPEGDSGRMPYIENPFYVIPLAPESQPTASADQPSDESEQAQESPESFPIGEPQLELSPLPGGGSREGVGRRGNRGATVQPKPLFIPWPKYPKGIKETHGSVELMVLVNERGEVEDIKVTRSLPAEELNRIAVEAARRIRFIPGTERGMRKSMWVRLAIGFQPR